MFVQIYYQLQVIRIIQINAKKCRNEYSNEIDMRVLFCQVRGVEYVAIIL